MFNGNGIGRANLVAAIAPDARAIVGHNLLLRVKGKCFSRAYLDTTATTDTFFGIEQGFRFMPLMPELEISGEQWPDQGVEQACPFLLFDTFEIGKHQS
jgi:hypothetical protein